MTLTLDITPVAEGESGLLHHVVAMIPGFIWVADEQACRMCREACSWLDLAFECRLHPGKCSQDMQADYEWQEMFEYLKSDEYRELVDRIRTSGDMMRCPNKGCHPPNYCGLCNGTGSI